MNVIFRENGRRTRSRTRPRSWDNRTRKPDFSGFFRNAKKAGRIPTPFLFVCVFSVCCTPRWPENAVQSPDAAPVFPLYADGIHIPCNMAPLNFVLPDSVRKTFVEIGSSCAKSRLRTRQEVSFPERFWRKATSAARNGRTDTLRMTITTRGASGRYVRYPEIRWIVSPDTIDPYLAYRLVQPTAGAYNTLELRQRCLENFDEKVLMSNKATGNNCFNCHTYRNGEANQMMIHLRKPSEGSLYFHNGEIRKVVLPSAEDALKHWPDSLRMPLHFVYAAWHPQGDYIAFCTNILGLSGYTAHKQYVNLFDSASNILLYRPGKRSATLPPALWTTSHEETWPAWSPDGKWLYFCRAARSDEELTRRYPQWGERVLHTHFDLCRIAFDPATGLFADTVQLLLKSDTAESYSVPRVHPDGRHLLLCRGSFNSVPYHSAGNLQLIDLENLDEKENPAEILNSDECESWHEWSANGRWVVFSSKRHDGHYAAPFIAYFNGKTFEKPFVLPQRSCRFYQTNLRSFNLPVFTRDASALTPEKAASGKQSPALEIEVR